MLYELGAKNEANCRLVPHTAAIVEEFAAVSSISGAVYFSVLAPHSRVHAHRGPTNMRARCHMGIKVPGQCGLRINGENLVWREGRCLVLDDYFTHEV